MELRKTGFSGEGGNSPWKGQPSPHGATAATTFVHSTNVIDLAAATGIVGLTPTVCSLDGLCWYCESGSRKCILTLKRVFDNNNVSRLEYADHLEISESPLQTGRDFFAR